MERRSDPADQHLEQRLARLEQGGQQWSEQQREQAQVRATRPCRGAGRDGIPRANAGLC